MAALVVDLMTIILVLIGGHLNMANPKQVREFLGLNQTSMAKAMGVHRNTWLKWERGEQDISAAPSQLLKTLLWLKSIDMLDNYLTFFSEKS